MVEPTILTISIAAFLFAAFLSQRAHDALLPYLPPQFDNAGQWVPHAGQWWAFAEHIFDRRTPLSIQFKAVCSNVLACIAATGFSFVGLIEWQNSNAHDRVGYLLLGLISALSLGISISSIRKYQYNLLLRKHEN